MKTYPYRYCARLNSIVVRRIGRDERDLVLLLFPLLGSFLIMGALMPHCGGYICPDRAFAESPAEDSAG